MCDIIESKINEFQPLDQVVFCRLVLDKVVVDKFPPSIFGSKHVHKLVLIAEEDELHENLFYLPLHVLALM